MQIKRELLRMIGMIVCFSLLLGTASEMPNVFADDGIVDLEGIDGDSGELDGELPAGDGTGAATEGEKPDTSGYQNALKDLNTQYQDLQNQQKAIETNINKAKSEKEKALAQKQQIDNQIWLTRQQITLINEKIDLLNQNIAAKETEIAHKELEISENYTIFKKRIRASYMNAEASSLGLLLGADDFYSFLTRSEILSRISARDEMILNQLVLDKQAIEDAKAQIELDKTEVEAAKTEQQNLQQTLGTQLGQTQQQLQDIAALEEQFLKDKAKNQKEMAAIQAEIDDIYAQLESMGEFVGGEFGWPSASYFSISSYYGWRFNNSDFHTGIDIAGSNIYGTNVIASNAGKVVYVNHSYTPGKGYGKYLIIDHGGGYSTLYAHNSDIVVSKGDFVTRGQTIAKVGSTGWSTGPHIHFEIRINGEATNPLEHLK